LFCASIKPENGNAVSIVSRQTERARSLPTLTTARLSAVHMGPGHAAPLLEFLRRNAGHMAPWDPPHPPDFDTIEYWEGECARAAEEHDEGLVARWLLFEHDDPGRVIGRINFTQIVRGPFHSCMLGYAIDAQRQGHGLMHEALTAAIAHVFDALRLHRIQANYVPDNVRSGRLLQRLGFCKEGVAVDYLFINGAWRDHVLTALVNPRFDVSVFGGAFRPTAAG
jgi:ribosomal-protein-alanine N-acetyltransferase